jgi:hypothetical protein
MGIPNATHQVASNAIAAQGNWISLHTGAGAGTTGANEATGGGYSRQQSTPWVQDGVGDNTGPQVNLSCAAGTYTEGGIFSASTGTALTVPSGASATAVSGGSLAVNTFYYVVTAFNWSGETTASAEVSATTSGSNLSIHVSWSAVAGISGATGIAALVSGYNIYRGTAPGAENLLVATVAPTATTYADTGAAGTSASAPGSNAASTFVGSAPFTGGSVTVSGLGASINVSPSVTA